jgi:hypothetical protein
MVAAVSAMALRLGESAFGRGCGKVAAFIDYVIPFALLAALVAGSVALASGLVH